jgi:hypothetical protein
MDTRFWGPSGWKFLHLCIELLPAIPTAVQLKIIHKFLTCWQYLLPCKYCRYSYTKYITSYPISQHGASRDELAHWIWIIHNKVNNKLRRQGYCTYKNPEFSNIRMLYRNLALNAKDSIKLLLELGHDFIGSIFMNYTTPVNKYYVELVHLLPQIFTIICNQSKIDNSSSTTMIKLQKYYETHQPSKINTKYMDWYYGLICVTDTNYCATRTKFYAHFSKYVVKSCSSSSSSTTMKKTASTNVRIRISKNSCRGLRP